MHALLFLALVPSAPAPAEKDVPKELKPLQGVWKVTAVEQGGRSVTGFGPGPAERPPLVIVGNGYVLGGSHAGTLKVDADTKAIDLTVAEGRSRGQVLPALFEVSGDTLKLAIPSTTRGAPGAARTVERPKELKSETGTRHTLYTFERDSKATREQAEAQFKRLKDILSAGPGNGFPSGSTAATNEALLRQIIERLDRIEKRLDEMEKKQGKPDKK